MPKDGSASYDKILRAAQEEFLEKGFERTTIRAIGQKAGLTSAAHAAVRVHDGPVRANRP